MLFALFVAAAGYSSPVTAISAMGDETYLGRADGAVERVDPGMKTDAVYAKPSGKRISFISASPYGLAWLAGAGGVIREKLAAAAPEEQILTIRSKDHFIAINVQPNAPIRRLSWLEGRVVLSYDFGSKFFDDRGREVQASAFMPADAAALAASGSLWVRELSDGTELTLFAKPYAVRRDPRNQKAPLVSLFTAYQVGAWQWAKLGGFASNAFDAFPESDLAATEDGKLAGDAKFFVLSDRVALADDGIVAREPDALANVPIFVKDWETARVEAASVPGDPLWSGADRDSAWWWTGSALVSQDRKTGQFAAYLPWSEAGIKVNCLADSQSGLWIGSNHGLRRLDPANPSGSGFVRIPFGLKDPMGDDPNAKRLSDAVFAWRFSDSQKAGEDGAIMVASVFGTLGANLLPTLAGVRAAGGPVAGELRFGDVIVSDHSAAIYLGNGSTVEVRAGRVQNGDIWSFSSAAVRRLF